MLQRVERNPTLSEGGVITEEMRDKAVRGFMQSDRARSTGMTHVDVEGRQRVFFLVWPNHYHDSSAPKSGSLP